jgi:hypothetical protein
MRKYKVGDIVKISKGSEHYGRNLSNPKEIEGIVVSNTAVSSNGYYYIVNWNNNQSCNYRDTDLILIKSVDDKSENENLKEENKMKKELLYKIGNRVRVKNTSSYYGNNDKDNPKDIEGIIENSYINNGFDWFVKWDNGGQNCYSESDLELVEPKIVVEDVRPKRRRLLLG